MNLPDGEICHAQAQAHALYINSIKKPLNRDFAFCVYNKQITTWLLLHTVFIRSFEHFTHSLAHSLLREMFKLANKNRMRAQHV